MSFAERFEDLEIWQAAQDLAVHVYQDFGAESAAARDFGFVNQIRDAAVSISNNIAEGFECSSHKEFERFLIISKRSCGEVRSMLHLAVRFATSIAQAPIRELFKPKSSAAALPHSFARSKTDPSTFHSSTFPPFDVPTSPLPTHGPSPIHHCRQR